MTERLYFTNSYVKDFESSVTACVPTADRFEIALAATAFYPTGGGQPHDLGVLGGRSVLDVIDRGDAGIAHVVDGPLGPGTMVKGAIDWTRRFDHMQQHSGQHILSAAFESTARARTESFHLGTKVCTIDLHREVSPSEIAAAEDEANRVVWEDHEVRLRFTSAEEATTLPLRKETPRGGALRLIEVPGFDLSACGGTHVARTGAVGLIAVSGWEKFKGGTRIEFVCGSRALRRIRECRDVFAATSRILSVLPADLAAAIERLQGENRTLGKQMREQQAQLGVLKAAELVALGERTADGRILVVEALEGWDATGLKAIATAVARTPGVCAALFSTTSPSLVVVSRAPDTTLDAAAVAKALSDQFGGKGGGKPEFAQAGGLTGAIGPMLGSARDFLGR